jgi:hypothetical protein
VWHRHVQNGGGCRRRARAALPYDTALASRAGSGVSLVAVRAELERIEPDLQGKKKAAKATAAGIASTYLIFVLRGLGRALVARSVHLRQRYEARGLR